VRIRGVPKSSSRADRIFRTVPAVYRRAIETNGDLYHIHDPELLAVALILCRRGKRVVYDVHEDYPSTIRHSAWLPLHLRGTVSSSFAEVERYASRKFSALIGANSEITKRVSSFNPLVITIANYPALRDYPSEPLFDKARYSSGTIVSFGGVSSRTCTRAIVEALGRIPSDLPVRLLLAGSERSEPLLSEIGQLPGWSRVRYTRMLAVREMLATLLEANLAFILFSPQPNHLGVGSNRFYESLAAGVPVITSNFPNWKETVNKTGCGIAVDPMDPRAIAEATIYLLSHPTESAEMGRRGYAIAQKHFNWERECRKLHALYEYLLKEPTSSRAGSNRDHALEFNVATSSD
jgi:glycosyltransferase involved in cell wall biosynthesis